MNKSKSLRLKSIVVLILTLFAGNSFSQNPIFSKTLAAAGQSETVFKIDKWGRYSIEVQSPEGAAIQLIDKKTGLREQSGIIGEKNGRIDLFLDFGEYKIISQAHQKGTVPPS